VCVHCCMPHASHKGLCLPCCCYAEVPTVNTEHERIIQQCRTPLMSECLTLLLPFLPVCCHAEVSAANTEREPLRHHTAVLHTTDVCGA
jgi:hypothetical protein